MAQIDKILQFMVKMKGSDLHLSSNAIPQIRVDGDMMKMSMPMLNSDQVWGLINEIMPDKNKNEFNERWDSDFAYEISGLSRFRSNVFMDRHGPGLVMRTIPETILTCDQLNLPAHVRRLALLSKGLVVVTGPTGSGKSTTLAAIVDECNKKRKDHIITIEDPIEFTHPNHNCLINQREVHTHTKSFSSALRAALREDPDIILMGEMRDLETISIALETAETGHLVFGTLHTTTAASTVDRVIDQFPADQQEQIRTMLSGSLKAVIAQTLLKKIGGGRIAALEILIGTSAIANLIREGKTFQIPSQLETGKKFGMQTLNDVLAGFVKNKIVEAKEACNKAVDQAAYNSKIIPIIIKMLKNNELQPLQALEGVPSPKDLIKGLEQDGYNKAKTNQLIVLADQLDSGEI